MARILRIHPFRTIREKFSALLAGCLLLVTAAVIPASRDMEFNRLPRPEVDLPPRPWIALTFDDGPHLHWTLALLDVLRKEGLPGTFFVVGRMAEKNPGLLRRIDADGHEIANHTYHHDRLPTLDNDRLLSELARTRELVRRLTGQDTRLYRPPGGNFTRRTLRLASSHGYRMVLWSVQTKDISGASPTVIRHKILAGARDGGIVLMHSGMPATLRALPEAAAELRRRGYHFVTVSQILGLQPPRRIAPELPPSSIDLASTGLAVTR